MGNSEKSSRFQSIIAAFPLADILDAAERFAQELDNDKDKGKRKDGKASLLGKSLKSLIKVLKMLLIVQPATAQVAGFVEVDCSVETNPKREMFDTMWKVAMEDDTITPDEKDFLLPHALAAGISEDEFERMVQGLEGPK